MVVAAENGWSVVAASPLAVPVATGPPLSASNELTRPPPVPITELREVTPAGAVHAVTAEDLTVQYDTSQSPAAGTVTVGVVAVDDVA